MTIPRRLLCLAALAASPAAAAAQGAPLPLTHDPRPTTPAITPADLMTRVYGFAADSMRGREVGTEATLRAAAHLAAELRRMGLRPAGEDGTFFQDLPMVRRELDESVALSVGGQALRPWVDYLPRDQGRGARSLSGRQAVYGGVWGEPLTLVSDAEAAGKVVVLRVPRGADGTPRWQVGRAAVARHFPSAAGIAYVSLHVLPRAVADSYRAPSLELRTDEPAAEGPAFVYVTPEAAGRLLGTPVESAPRAAPGGVLEGDVRWRDVPAPARNVVAVLPGRDPRLSAEYVALGSHFDHVGVAAEPVDHDSLALFNRLFRPGGLDQPHPGELSAPQAAALGAALDSVRALRAPRADSVFNGADDDASGAMAMLEIAEALSAAREKPRRSVLFVWHTAEEVGLVGSDWWTTHPTVPRDAIVAQLNMDMIGRGTGADAPSADYLQLIGSRRLSTGLGDLVEEVNRARERPFALDYTYDADGHPQQYYCRSDHYSYARFGIPVTFFSTGGHADYHMLTDEPQYVDYANLARVTRLIHDVAVRVADLDARPAVDGRVMGPDEPCRQ